MIYLLDTDALVYLVRGLKSPPRHERQRERFRAAEKILAHCQRRQAAGDEIGLSAITVAELEHGAQGSEDYEMEIFRRAKNSPAVCELRI